MKSCRAAAVLVFWAGVAGAAAAQGATPKIEAGLWDLAFTLKSDNGQVEAAMREVKRQLALMSPAQRKQMEDMMAAKGVKLGDQASSVQACISKEDAARGEIPQQPGTCTQEILERSATSMRVKFSCSTSPPASGEAVVNFQSPTAYTSQATIDTEVSGLPQRVKVDQTGRWVSADCGAVRPLGR